MGKDSPEIAVGTTRGGLYLGLRGHATQRTCPTANRLVDDYLASRPRPPTVVVDLADCEWVDSTFAGWLLGLSRRIEPLANGTLLVAGCAEGCRTSLERLGLADRLRFEEVEPPADTRIISCTASDQLTPEELKLMLAAHEALAALSPDNERIFAPIVVALRAQLENS